MAGNPRTPPTSDTLTVTKYRTNEQIVGIVEQAHKDMIAARLEDRNNFPQMKFPNVMSAIVVGHSVYLSSTFMGGGSMLYIPNANPTNPRQKWIPGILNQANAVGAVEHALIACQARSTNNAGHSHGGNYGEPMAALAIIRTSSAASLKGAKVVTWGRFKDRNNGNKCLGDRRYKPLWRRIWAGRYRRLGLRAIYWARVIPAGTQSANLTTTQPLAIHVLVKRYPHGRHHRRHA
jgi:hypothetical protein